MTFLLSQTYRVAVEIGSSCAWLAESRPGADPSPYPVYLEPVAYGPDGDLRVGPAARQDGVQDPTSGVASYLSRIGDDLPLLLAGRAVAPEDLLAQVLRRELDAVAERHGGAAAEIRVVLPAEWGPHRQARVREALEHHAITPLRLMPAPAAALLDPRLDLPPDARTALVLDGGDRRISATLLERLAASPTDGTTDDTSGAGGGGGGWRVRGATGDDFGGSDIDDALLGFVRERSGDDPPTDGIALRRACRTAREDLSTAPAAVLTPPGDGEPLRLVRAELELLVGGRLRTAVAALLTRLDVRPGAVDDIRPAAADGEADGAGSAVDAVVLCGGLARMPLLVETVSGLVDRPVLVAAEPDQAALRGAARETVVAPGVPAVPGVPGALDVSGVPDVPGVLGASGIPAAVPPPTPSPAGRHRRRRGPLNRYSGLAAGVAAVALLVSAPLASPGLSGGLADLIAGGPGSTADAAESRSATAAGWRAPRAGQDGTASKPRGPLQVLADLLIPDTIAATLVKPSAEATPDATAAPSPLRALAERLLPGTKASGQAPTAATPGAPAAPTGTGQPATDQPATSDPTGAPTTEVPPPANGGGDTTAPPTQQPEPTQPAPTSGGGSSTQPPDPGPSAPDPAPPAPDPAPPATTDPAPPASDPAPPAPSSDPAPQSVAPADIPSATEV